MREAAALRRMDFHVKIASINPPKQPLARMTVEEREEAAATFYVKSASLNQIARSHLMTLMRTPGTYLSGLRFALALGGLDLRRILFGFFYFVEAVMIGRWMEAEELRHLHVHFANAAATVALIAARIFPIKFSLTVHGPDEFYDTAGTLLKEKIAAASLICCIGYFARSQLMKLAPFEHWDKLEVVPLGVNPEFFTPVSRETAERCEILCVGRLVPAKGQHILLAAFAELVRRGHAVRLRLVGEGPDRASLERAVAAAGLGEQVIFAGALNQDQVRQLYRTADLFALASFAEGIPVVLMEAMAMAIPCVSTFVAGIPELIVSERDGILVMPSDVQALTAALERLLRDPELRRRFGAAGRQRVLEKYDLNHNIRHLAQIFSRRLGELECGIGEISERRQP
ncbi:MAG TPA: glycosyltransferase family 4 protein [Candidatus Binataceae bacterium]|nr:glycosyltransferase family 4 protein [Candidatus Binataceae bacterium]